MESTTRISVAIPAYGEGKYIGRTLRCLERQTHREFEVIICLNGTDHDTEAAILNYQERKFSPLNIKIVHEPQMGVAKARQRAFEQAAGQIIVSADADVEYPPWWLERIEKAFSKNPEAVCVCGPVRHKGARGWARIYLNYAYPFIDILARQVSDLLGLVNVIGSNLAVKRKAFQRVGGFNTSLRSFEDNELANRLKEEGEIIYSPKLVVHPSARRYNQSGPLKVLLWNLKNYIQVILLEMEGDGFYNARCPN